MGKPLKRIGDWVETCTIDAFVRGKAAIKGQYFMADFAQADADTTNITIGSRNSVFANVITPTTAGIAAAYPIYIAEEAIAEDEWGTFVAYGVTDGAFADDDVGTTDIEAGGALEVNNAVNYADGAGAASRIVGIALEAALASSGSGTDQVDASSTRKKTLHFGGMPGWGWLTAA